MEETPPKRHQTFTGEQYEYSVIGMKKKPSITSLVNENEKKAGDHFLHSKISWERMRNQLS